MRPLSDSKNGPKLLKSDIFIACRWSERHLNLLKKCELTGRAASGLPGPFFRRLEVELIRLIS